MITVTKQTEQEQREMYSKMLKADVIDMLIESNKHLNRILENTFPIYGVVVNEAEKVDKKPNKNIKNTSKKPIDDCEYGSEVPFCQCKQPKMLSVEEIDRNRCKICKRPFW